MKTGIVLCSRLYSERLPKKVFRKVNGISVFARLVSRLLITNIPVIVAVPKDQVAEYVREAHASGFTLDPDRLMIFPSDFDDDPLARTHEVIQRFGFSRIVRITHDKIFVDIEQIPEALEVFDRSRAEYLYLPDMLPGTGFEIISAKCIAEATSRFKNVEHLSYAARLVSSCTIRLPSNRPMPDVPLSLLIDFSEDLEILEVIFSQLGNDVGMSGVIKFINENPEIAKINEAPLLTIYTCAYNAAEFIEAAMLSVETQSIFRRAEYIIIDDHSSDTTCMQIAKFAIGKPNVRWARNERNLGLASSSNIALKHARGKYIIRLDADDFFTGQKTLAEFVDYAEKRGFEATYPNNHYGAFNKIQHGSEQHHVGGAIFDKRAINFVKFTDGLRNLEGLDLFVRAKDRLKIGYYEKPVFFYTQHPASMSKTNLKEREETRRKIEAVSV